MSLDTLYGSSPRSHITWEEFEEGSREFYRVEAEAVVLSFGEIFIPVIVSMLSPDEIKELLSSLQ